jgi:hypothetical protein
MPCSAGKKSIDIGDEDVSAVSEVCYEYIVNGDKYADIFGKPFISPESGKDYASQFVKGVDFKVRVKPDDPTKSVPLWGSRFDGLSVLSPSTPG